MRFYQQMEDDGESCELNARLGQKEMFLAMTDWKHHLIYV